MTSSSSGRTGKNGGISASDLTAIRVKDLRRRRGMTAAQFAARCTELGASSITTNVVANIETRRRDVSVNELLVFALALDVPPLFLLTPVADPDSTSSDSGASSKPAGRALAITPTVQIEDPQLAARWIHGEEALPANQARLYYAFTLENMRAPDTDRALSQYAKAVVQDGAKRLATQYEAQAEQFQSGVREQVTALLSGLEDAVTQATSQSEVLEVLGDARTRLNKPGSTPGAEAGA
jgi:transcriptional regulator with XRE-family HTH domain